MAKEKEEKQNSMEKALEFLNKKYGDGTVLQYGDNPKPGIEVIPTGSLNLDNALGVGGFPRGRIIELYGEESSAKSSLALTVIANCQRMGGKCAFVDTEHSFDISYANKLGVNVDTLVISQPEYGEQALDIVDVLVRSGEIECIVVDSVAALVPKAELEGEMGQAHMGIQSRLMSQAMRKLAGVVSVSKCCVIFTNQTRSKIGVVYGNPKTTSGGNALKFYATIRLEMKKAETLKDGENLYGVRIHVIVRKNKVSAPFKEADFDLIFGEGIDRISEVMDTAIRNGKMEKSGAWYSFSGQRIGQGKDNAREFIKSNPEIYKQILDAIGIKE